MQPACDMCASNASAGVNAAGIESLFAAADEVFKTKVAAQTDGLREPRARRLQDSINMLAQ